MSSKSSIVCSSCGKSYASAKTLENHQKKGCKVKVAENRTEGSEKKEEPSSSVSSVPPVTSSSTSPDVTLRVEEQVRLLQLEVKEKDKLYAEMKEEKEKQYEEMKEVLIEQIVFLKEKLKEIMAKFCEQTIEHIKRPHQTVNVISNNYMPEEYHLKENMAYLPANMDLNKLVNEVIPAALKERAEKAAALKNNGNEFDSDDDNETTTTTSYIRHDPQGFISQKGYTTTTTSTRVIKEIPPPPTVFKEK